MKIYSAREIRHKFMWWLAWHIPKQAALYAFVRVASVLMEAPEANGEYSRAYKLFVKTHRINE